MKKLVFLIIFSLVLIFSYCSKKGTESTAEEDKITIEVLVKESGIPAENLFVIVVSKVQESVKNFGARENDEVISYEVTQTDQLTTSSYGKVLFTYVNKSLPDRGGIIIETITIKRMNDVLYEDLEEKFIEKGESLKLEYDI